GPQGRGSITLRLQLAQERVQSSTQAQVLASVQVSVFDPAPPNNLVVPVSVVEVGPEDRQVDVKIFDIAPGTWRVVARGFDTLGQPIPSLVSRPIDVVIVAGQVTVQQVDLAGGGVHS